MKPVVIFGLGSYARVAKIYLDNDSPYQVVAYTANAEYITEKSLLHTPIVPFEELLSSHPPDDYQLLIAMGARNMNNDRARIYQECKSMGYEFVTYVNSKAIQWGEVEVGENTFIFESNVLQPFVKIGNNTVLWSGNHIGHDVAIGDNVFIASHAVISGHVAIGNNCFIGVNATFVDGITIAPYTLVGAGAFITRNTEEEGAYIGMRAEKSSRKSTEFKI